MGKLKLLNLLLKLKILFKNVIYTLKYINTNVILPKNFFIKIILTWAFEQNFNKDGSLNDKYFNLNQKDLKILCG